MSDHESKTCSTCKSTLPATSFSRKGKIRQAICRECSKSRSKAYYKQNKDTMKPQIYSLRCNRVSVLRAAVSAIKAELGCCSCGERESCALDFHHATDTKELSISRMILHCTGVVRLNDELSKCVVVCSNCHRKHHAGLLSLPAEHLGKIELPTALMKTARYKT